MLTDRNSLNVRYKYVQSHRENCRERFRNGYLANLAHKDRQKTNVLKVGVVVLIETGPKRLTWPLGLIKELYPGIDGEVRAVKVKTEKGEVNRPVQKLYPLEIGYGEEYGTVEKDVTECEHVDRTDQREDVCLNRDLVRTRSGRAVKIPQRLDL